MLIAIQIFLWILAGYFVIGLIFGFWFIFQGILKLDPETRSSGWGFRFLMLPGAIGLWPVLLDRLVKKQ